VTGTTVINQTNVLPAAGAAGIGAGKLIAILAVAGAAAAAGAVAATHGGNGTPTTTPPGATVTAGTGAVGAP